MFSISRLRKYLTESTPTTWWQAFLEAGLYNSGERNLETVLSGFGLVTGVVLLACELGI